MEKITNVMQQLEKNLNMLKPGDVVTKEFVDENEKLLSNLKKLTIKNPEKLEKVATSLRDIKIKCLQVYGGGCYELSGETEYINTNLESFIFNISEDYIVKDKKGIPLPQMIIDGIIDGIENSKMGCGNKIRYEDLKISPKIDINELKNLLSKLRIDESAWNICFKRNFEDF